MRVLDRKIRGNKGEAKGKKDGCCNTRQGTKQDVYRTQCRFTIRKKKMRGLSNRQCTVKKEM
jgi:hypothetical protein